MIAMQGHFTLRWGGSVALPPMNCFCKSLLPSGARLIGFATPRASQNLWSPQPDRASHRKWRSPRPCSIFAPSSSRFCVTASQDKQPATEDSLRPWVSTIGENVKDLNKKSHLQVVLFSPQIAGNTGCIARTCAAASVGLHLIEPLGFQIDDAKLKRAGLDYWPFVVVKVHPSWSEFMHYFRQQEGEKRLVAFTKRGTCLYTAKEYKPGDWLVFGSETSGLSPEALEDCADESSYGGGKVRIPMLDTYVRSLNLAVSAGIGVYEALRQLDVLEDLAGDESHQLNASEEIHGDTSYDDKSSMGHLVNVMEA